MLEHGLEIVMVFQFGCAIGTHRLNRMSESNEHRDQNLAFVVWFHTHFCKQSERACYPTYEGFLDMQMFMGMGINSSYSFEKCATESAFAGMQ